jgi:diacylglycerol O-acyltransferase / wax synthase
VGSYERLSAQDASFLHVERGNAPMHVGSLGIFEGAPFFDDSGRFRLQEARDRVAGRLHLVPRFRRRLLTVPLQQGRPIWVDDEAFDIDYHVRLTALPRPGSEEQLLALMGRLQGQPLDRRRPLWELWFVEGLEGGRVAIIQKTHHALVDGISGVDVATVILDLDSDAPVAESPEWVPEHTPNSARLLLDTLGERATQPAELVRTLRSAVRGPRRAASGVARVARTVATLGRGAPRLPFNVTIGPHRRVELVRTSLAQIKAARAGLNATVNDVVLAVVAGGLRHYLANRGELTEGLVVRTMVPVSVRDPSERMLLGNRVAAVVVDLPVGEADPVQRLLQIAAQTRDLKESQQAVGAGALVALADFAPPTLLALAARLLPFQRSINLGVTNVPGPQIALYCMGARMLEAFPYVGIFDGMALMIAALSYDGQLNIALVGDRDALADLGVLAEGIDKSLAALVAR